MTGHSTSEIWLTGVGITLVSAGFLIIGVAWVTTLPSAPSAICFGFGSFAMGFTVRSWIVLVRNRRRP